MDRHTGGACAVHELQSLLAHISVYLLACMWCDCTIACKQRISAHKIKLK